MKNIKIQLLFLLIVFIFPFQLISQPPYPEWKQYLPATSIWKMKLEGNTLYASTNHFGFGLIALDLNTNQTQVFSEYSAGLASDNITAIDVDADGNIWLGHKGHGVTKLSGDLCTIFNTENSGLINDSITTICVDLNGNIWIG